jgi:hypothetical protein
MVMLILYGVCLALGLIIDYFIPGAGGVVVGRWLVIGGS